MRLKNGDITILKCKDCGANLSVRIIRQQLDEKGKRGKQVEQELFCDKCNKSYNVVQAFKNRNYASKEQTKEA